MLPYGSLLMMMVEDGGVATVAPKVVDKSHPPNSYAAASYAVISALDTGVDTHLMILNIYSLINTLPKT